MKNLSTISRIAIAIASLLMVSAFYVPIWQILMWAPQYPEGLQMKIWINNITGDVKIISALNHYIGMRHIDVEMFPEFTYMKYIVIALIGFGLLTALLKKRIGLIIFLALVLASGAAALTDFYWWAYDYGHNLDPRAPIIVPGMSYQPPLIGTKQLLNFTAFSGPDTGGWIFLVSGLLLIGTLVFEIYSTRKRKRTPTTVGLAILFACCLFSCSMKPEPLQYNKDTCYACKMTLVDQKFGAEVVTMKGKIFKFDDLNCLIQFLNTGEVDSTTIEHILVADYTHPGTLIDVGDAAFLRSESIKSPMASNVAAFRDQQSLKQINETVNGQMITWKKLQTGFH